MEQELSAWRRGQARWRVVQVTERSGCGTHNQALEGHDGPVVALLAYGQGLSSSSFDKMVMVQSMATWACVQMVQAYPAESDQLISRLAMSAIEQIDAGGRVL